MKKLATTIALGAGLALSSPPQEISNKPIQQETPSQISRDALVLSGTVGTGLITIGIGVHMLGKQRKFYEHLSEGNFATIKTKHLKKHLKGVEEAKRKLEKAGVSIPTSPSRKIFEIEEELRRRQSEL